MRISDWSSDVCSSDLQVKDRLLRHRKGEIPIKIAAAAGDEFVDEPFVQLAKLWAKAFHLRLRPARHQCFADLLMRRPIDEGDDSFQVSASGMVAPCGAHSVHPLRILQLCYRGAQYLVDLRMPGQHPHVSAAGAARKSVAQGTSVSVRVDLGGR